MVVSHEGALLILYGNFHFFFLSSIFITFLKSYCLFVEDYRAYLRPSICTVKHL